MPIPEMKRCEAKAAYGNPFNFTSLKQCSFTAKDGERFCGVHLRVYEKQQAAASKTRVTKHGLQQVL
jgi:hypothetical protein